MDNMVLNYVARIVPHQRLQLYVDCHTVLTEHYPEGWQTVLDTIGTHLESKTINDIEYLLHSAIISNLIAVVQECGVYVSDRYDFHHNLRQLYYLARGLYLIESYPNIVALRTLYDAHTSSHDRLGNILAEVQPGFDIDNFYMMVKDISDGTMIRLDHALRTNLEYIEPLLEQHGLTAVVQELITGYATDYPAIAEIRSRTSLAPWTRTLLPTAATSSVQSRRWPPASSCSAPCSPVWKRPKRVRALALLSSTCTVTTCAWVSA
jgi:hypothetical protein